MAESRAPKVIHGEEVDRISTLPSEIKEIILNFLSIRDVVQTSILSTRWRNCWKQIPHLVFDHHFLAQMTTEVLDELSHEDQPCLQAYRFVGVILRILRSHIGPITKFHLVFYKGFNAQVVSHNLNNHCVPLLSQNGHLRQLALEDVGFGDLSQKFYVEAWQLSDFAKLTHLKLTSVQVRSTRPHGGFRCLTTLELFNVQFDDRLIFDCPVLERLILDSCMGVIHTNFCAPKLKCLHETSYAIPLAGLQNLTEFAFGLLGMPGFVLSYNLIKLLESLPNTEKLLIKKSALKYLALRGFPAILPNPILHLKTLVISEVNFAKFSEVSCMLLLILSPPNLSHLEISALINNDGEGNIENHRCHTRAYKECCIMSQLKVVKFYNLNGVRAELELIKFLLANSPSLKTLDINLNQSISGDAAFAMAIEIFKYYRASRQVEIRHIRN